MFLPRADWIRVARYIERYYIEARPLAQRIRALAEDDRWELELTKSTERTPTAVQTVHPEVYIGLRVAEVDYVAAVKPFLYPKNTPMGTYPIFRAIKQAPPVYAKPPKLRWEHHQRNQLYARTRMRKEYSEPFEDTIKKYVLTKDLTLDSIPDKLTNEGEKTYVPNATNS